MPILRANALRSLQSSLRHSGARATARVAAPSRTQLVVKRFASSGHGDHGAHQSSSDLPWMLGALAVTPPAMWYLWPEPHSDDHHGGHGHEEHAEEEGKPSEEDQSAEDEAPQEDSAPAEQADEPEKGSQEDGEKQEEGGDKGEDAKEDEDSANKSKAEGTTEVKDSATDPEENVKNPMKGPMHKDSPGQVDERKSEPRPSKDSRVKRIDSGLGKNLGEGDTYDENGKETQATSKEAGSSAGDITQKQKGLSTTDTRHSEKIDENPEKSKKGTGEPETAKAKGTVDPNAPVRGGPNKS